MVKDNKTRNIVIAIAVIVVLVVISFTGCNAFQPADPVSDEPAVVVETEQPADEASVTETDTTESQASEPEAVKPESAPTQPSKPTVSESSSTSQSPASTQTHEHSWTYHEAQYETVHHSAVTKGLAYCTNCGADITSNISSHKENHMLNGESAGHRVETVVVTPAYDEQVLVKAAYYSCSCGAAK